MRLEQIARQELHRSEGEGDLVASRSWAGLCRRLEEIRALAASCAELDPASSVALRVSQVLAAAHDEAVCASINRPDQPVRLCLPTLAVSP